MFARHCTACDKTQLIFPAAITGIVKVAEGFAVSYECWCGADQVWLTAGDLSPELSVSAA